MAWYWILSGYILSCGVYVLIDYIRYHRKPQYMKSDKFYGMEPKKSDWKMLSGVWFASLFMPLIYLIVWGQQFVDWIKSLK